MVCGVAILSGSLLNTVPAPPSPDFKAQIAKAFANKINYPGLRASELDGKPDHDLRAVIDRMKDNLRTLVGTMPKAEVAKNKLWYDGAHSIADGLSKAGGVDIASASGTLASLSPQKD